MKRRVVCTVEVMGDRLLVSAPESLDLLVAYATLGRSILAAPNLFRGPLRKEVARHLKAINAPGGETAPASAAGEGKPS